MVDPAVANGKKLFLWCDFSLDGVMSASKCLCPGWEESATIHKGRDYRLFVSFLHSRLYDNKMSFMRGVLA